MVAYSFKRRFEPLILDGSKDQTIRGDRRRHARPGEELQLYVDMRTRHCRLLGRPICLDARPITLIFRDGDGVAMDGFRETYGDLDNFARADGFGSWAELKGFWADNHPGKEVFDGVLIRWKPLGAGNAPEGSPSPSDGRRHGGAPSRRSSPVQNPF